jgi:hypothetical protein
LASSAKKATTPDDNDYPTLAHHSMPSPFSIGLLIFLSAIFLSSQIPSTPRFTNQSCFAQLPHISRFLFFAIKMPTNPTTQASSPAVLRIESNTRSTNKIIFRHNLLPPKTLQQSKKNFLAFRPPTLLYSRLMV